MNLAMCLWKGLRQHAQSNAAASLRSNQRSRGGRDGGRTTLTTLSWSPSFMWWPMAALSICKSREHVDKEAKIGRLHRPTRGDFLRCSRPGENWLSAPPESWPSIT
jgi:hypothetical protein